MKKTYHAEDRIKERLGKVKKNERILKLATERGITSDTNIKKLKKYLLNVEEKNECKAYIYTQNVWLFKNNRLITMFPVNKELIKYINGGKNEKNS